MAIYMKFGSINGDVTTDGYKDWISLDSFQLGVGRGIGSAAGGLDNREGSEPSVSEVTISKQMDKASPKLFQDAVGGDLGAKVQIAFTTTTKDKVDKYLEYELTNCGLSGYSVSSGGDRPTESLSLNFTKIVWSFTAKDAKVGGSPEKVGWDLATQKKV